MGATVYLPVGKIKLKTSWEKYIIPINAPSVSGKILGTNSYSGVAFWFDGGANFDFRAGSLGHQSGTFDIAQVKLEHGSIATPFNDDPILNKIRCRRYFQRYDNVRFGGVYAVSTTWYYPSSVFLPVSMRNAPTYIVRSAIIGGIGAVNVANVFLNSNESSIFNARSVEQGSGTPNNSNYLELSVDLDSEIY